MDHTTTTTIIILPLLFILIIIVILTMIIPPLPPRVHHHYQTHNFFIIKLSTSVKLLPNNILALAYLLDAVGGGLQCIPELGLLGQDLLLVLQALVLLLDHGLLEPATLLQLLHHVL